ncbi:MAG: pyruvate kinase [Thiobacillus sp.]|uniref:pyruvate kinase n=1 Tax=Thiobacillus sp. TaxID=924 RepID=UPI00273313E3|nr:pyruvate kinase [Thiobacillus sp.]MDP3585607.1 pyruvate kinase [Thiobacillus sp.]
MTVAEASGPNPVCPDSPGVELALTELTRIRADMLANESRTQPHLADIHANYRDSSRNLLHYLALRRRDLRPLQRALAAMGVSSLGRAESNVLASVDAVLRVLGTLVRGACQDAPRASDEFEFARGERLLAEHTDALLGPATNGRPVRIMVTMPSEAADDYLLVHHLLQQGMDCMRINCAHDDAAAWARMIEHLKQAERALGRACRVFMDLAGPKLRTGPLEPGPAVIRIHPRRDAYGRVTAPARVWLSPEDAPVQPPSPASACLPVPSDWLSRLQVGEVVKFTDARDSRRTFKIVDVTDQGCWAEAGRTAYLVPGTRLQAAPGEGDADARACRLGALPPGDTAIALQRGDLLIVTRDLKPGRAATYDSMGALLTPAMIGCTIPDVFEHVRAGETIWFDDGKIGGVIEKVEPSQVRVRITQEYLRAVNLRADKGINLPDSDLRIAAMTDKDIEDLPFVAQHADIVGLSFANCAQDVAALQARLASLGSRQPAIVLKIETRRGFENLPDMLLTAMRAPQCGVMIARGDLAVECGFERLAEVQEEILWLCEAAHVPVIWATQVLETLAKEGRPSRAEITDAAMGLRAECVMLNKGPYVLSAVRALDDILRRMHAHQAKKRSMLRALRLAHKLPIESGAATWTAEPES